jgi:vacuolar protein 8
MICLHEPVATAAHEANVVSALLCILNASDDTALLRSAMGALYVNTNCDASHPAKTAALDSNGIVTVIKIIEAGKTEVYETGPGVIRNITFLEEAKLPAAEAGAVAPLVKILSSTDVHVLQFSCQALRNICWSNDVPRIQALEAGAIPALIGLLSHSNVRVQDSAAFALWKVCLNETAATAAHEANATPKLIRILSSDDILPLKAAMGALYALTMHDASRPAILMALTLDAISAIVRLINLSRTEIYEMGAAAIRNITIHSEAEIPAVDAGCPCSRQTPICHRNRCSATGLRGLEKHLLVG